MDKSVVAFHSLLFFFMSSILIQANSLFIASLIQWLMDKIDPFWETLLLLHCMKQIFCMLYINKNGRPNSVPSYPVPCALDRRIMINSDHSLYLATVYSHHSMRSHTVMATQSWPSHHMTLQFIEKYREVNICQCPGREPINITQNNQLDMNHICTLLEFIFFF